MYRNSDKLIKNYEKVVIIERNKISQHTFNVNTKFVVLKMLHQFWRPVFEQFSTQMCSMHMAGWAAVPFLSLTQYRVTVLYMSRYEM